MRRRAIERFPDVERAKGLIPEKVIPARSGGRILRPTENYLGFVLLMNDTPNLALPFILPAQAQKHVTHNEAIRALDCLVHLSVMSRTLNEPPASPGDGSRFIVAADAGAGWTGHDGNVAAYQDGTWAFYAPKTGWRAWCVAESALLVFQDGAWSVVSSGEGGGSGDLPDAFDNLTRVGINATADTTNRLALKSPASLFDNDGAGHQQKINKAAAGDTASVLYQTSYSGRAEMGLAGDDDFHFKVSPNGSTWYEALKIDRNTGRVLFPIMGGPREVLTADRSYYVRTDGSDGNSGLANTSGAAFKTIQKAFDTVGGLDLSIYNVTINVGAGTYTAGVNMRARALGAGSVSLVGDTTTPSNVVISVTNGDCINCSGGASLNIGGFKLQTTTNGNGLISNAANVSITGKMDFGSIVGQQIYVLSGGKITCTVAYNITGGAASHLYASGPGSQITDAINTVTLTGTPAFSTAFAHADTLSAVVAFGQTYSGAATGKRFEVSANAVINTASGGANYFPGNASGSGTNSGATPFGLYQ